MKTQILTLIAVLCIVGTGWANQTEKSITYYEDAEVTNMMTKIINFPSFEDQSVESGEVIVRFMVNDEGYIVVNEVYSSHIVFAEYIFKKLSGYRLKMVDEDTIGKELTYKFSFKTGM